MTNTKQRLGKTLAKPIRHVDSTGRVTLPHGIRVKLGLDTNDKVTFEVVNGVAIIRPLDTPSACTHCGGTGHEPH